MTDLPSESAPRHRDERQFVDATQVWETGPSDVASSLVIPNAGIPTQVANPTRTSWRTFVQSAISFLIVANSAIVVVAQFLASNPDLAQLIPAELYGPLVAIVNGAVLVGSYLAKLAAQIMANRRVNEWIQRNIPWLAPIRVESS